MLALGSRAGTVATKAEVQTTAEVVKLGASAEMRAATLAGSFTSSTHRALTTFLHGNGVVVVRQGLAFKELTGAVTAGVTDDTSVYLWCTPDIVTATQAASPDSEWSFNSQPPSLEDSAWSIDTGDAASDRVAYMTDAYGDYSIVQAQSSMRRSKPWSLTFKASGDDCGVNNHGQAAGSGGDVVKCNIGVSHKQAPTVGQRMQYFWYLHSSFRGGREQYATAHFGFNVRNDGKKLWEKSFEDYSQSFGSFLEEPVGWSDNDSFGILFDGANVVFTHNGHVVHKHDAWNDYIVRSESASHVEFSSHWHLHGTPVHDLSFSPL
jgi:hypothetical protein